MNWPAHGANPRYIYKAMNLPIPEEIIDLSANINPLGPPQILKEIWSDLFSDIAEYPDPEAASLREMIASKEKLEEEMVMVANGGAELIALLGRLFARKKILIIQPTFSEYEQACRANHCEIIYHFLDENWQFSLNELPLNEVEAVFLCNPNNPTGVCFSFEQMLSLAKRCKEHEAYLVIDEAFYDFYKGYRSLVPFLQHYANVILLRSMTKMFAIPSLRLGYILADKRIIASLKNYKSHWSVNGIAIRAGEACLKEEVFIEQTRDYVENERKRLFAFFQKEGYEFSPSQTNFYLLRWPYIESQLPLFAYLLQEGIVLRHTMNFPGIEGHWLRVAIKSKAENNQLLAALKGWRK